MRNYKDISIWKDTTLEQWNDWKWQMKNRIMDADKLGNILNLQDNTKEEIEKCLQRFRMAVTPYYATLIDRTIPSVL